MGNAAEWTAVSDWPAPLATIATVSLYYNTVTGINDLEVLTVRPSDLGTLTSFPPNSTAGACGFTRNSDGTTVTIALNDATPGAYNASYGVTYICPWVAVPCVRAPGHSAVYRFARPDPTTSDAAFSTSNAFTALPSLVDWAGAILCNARDGVANNPGQTWTRLNFLYLTSPTTWTNILGSDRTLAAIPNENTTTGPTSVRLLPRVNFRSPSAFFILTSFPFNLSRSSWIDAAGTWMGTANGVRDYPVGEIVAGLSGTILYTLPSTISGKKLSDAINGLWFLVPGTGATTVAYRGVTRDPTYAEDTYANYTILKVVIAPATFYLSRGGCSADDIAWPLGSYGGTSQSSKFVDMYGSASDLTIVQQLKDGTIPKLVNQNLTSGYEENDIMRPHRLALGWVALLDGGTIPEGLVAATLQWEKNVTDYSDTAPGANSSTRYLNTWKVQWDASALSGAGAYVWVKVDEASASSVAVSSYVWTFLTQTKTTYRCRYTVAASGEWHHGWAVGIRYVVTGPGALDQSLPTGSGPGIGEPYDANIRRTPFAGPYPYSVGRFLGGGTSGGYVRLTGQIKTSLRTYQGGHDLTWRTYSGTPRTVTGSVNVAARTVTLTMGTAAWILEPVSPDPEKAVPAPPPGYSNYGVPYLPPIQFGASASVPHRWDANAGRTASGNEGYYVVVISDNKGRFLKEWGVSHWSKWAKRTMANVAGSFTLHPAAADVTQITIDIWQYVAWTNVIDSNIVSRRWLRTYVADLVAGTFTLTRDDYPT